MTSREFFAASEKLKHWRRLELDDKGIIRVAPPYRRLCFCPLTAVCFIGTGKYFSVQKAFLAAEFLKLDPRFARRVINASDYGRPHPKLRFKINRYFPKAKAA